MTKLNDVSLYWFMSNKKISLEDHVRQALEKWDKRKDLRDVVPEYVDFNVGEFEDVQDESILGLTVRFSKYVQKNHFKITGTL